MRQQNEASRRNAMTNEEAIHILTVHQTTLNDDTDVFSAKMQKVIAKDSEAFKMAISALERDRWIDVTEKLPEKPEIVLVTQVKQVDGEIVRVTRSMMFDGHSFCAYGSTQQGIWAWRPLPEPYSESEGEHER
jgi:hypothetical protein